MSGILLPGLTIAFVTLKLADYIDWSWWLVLAPTWVPAIIAAVIVALKVYVEGPKRKKLR